MSAHFGVSCRCGASRAVVCPTLPDIETAIRSLDGWGYDDKRLICCPACIAGSGETETRAAAGQLDMFGRAA